MSPLAFCLTWDTTLYTESVLTMALWQKTRVVKVALIQSIWLPCTCSSIISCRDGFRIAIEVFRDAAACRA